MHTCVVPDHILQQEKADAEARAQKHGMRQKSRRFGRICWRSEAEVASDPFVRRGRLDARRSAAKFLCLHSPSGQRVTSDCHFSYSSAEVLDCLGATGETNILRYKVGSLVPSEIKAVKDGKGFRCRITLVP